MGSDMCYYDKEVKEIALFKYWLGISGSWPLDINSVSAKVRRTVTVLCEIFTFSSLTLDVIQHCKGWELALDALMMDGSSIVSCSKLLTNTFTWDYKRQLMESLIEDWSALRPSIHWRIMEGHAIRARRIYIIFLSWCINCVFAYILVAMPWHWFILERSQWNVSEYREYVLPAHCVWADVSTPVYCLILVQNCLEMIVHTASQTGNDSFLMMLTAHLAGQFHTLREDFASMRMEGSVTSLKMRGLVNKHNRLVHLSKTLERAFNPNILYQFFMSVILLCTEGFQFILCLSLNDTENTIKHMTLIMTLVTQLFLYSNAGQSLEEESLALRFAVYESNWYDFDLKTMKVLPLIMVHADIPQQLTAGKFVVMNFMSFKDMLKASASYLSVLRVMLESQ